MSWSIKSLREKIWRLDLAIKETKDPKIREMLTTDLDNLKSMVNYKLGDEIYELENSKMYIVDKEYVVDQAVTLKTFGHDYAIAARKYSYIHHLPSKFSLPKYVFIPEFSELFCEFLKYFDNNLLSLYNKFQEENRIEINSRYYERKTCRGQCHPMVTEGSSYISSRYNNRFDYITNIPHEIAHAYQFEGITDFSLVQNRLLSLFGEAYSFFVEYAFLDFLKNTKYKKQAWIEESQLINNFLCLIDYYLSALQAVPELQIDSKGYMQYNGYLTSFKNCNDILSHMLAMYWYNVYQENPKDAIRMVNQFNEEFGIKKMSEILQEYNAELLAEGVDSNIRRYLNYYHKK